MEWWELDDQEREDASMLAILPFYHVFAMTCCLNFVLMMGGKVIMATHGDRDKLLAGIPKMLQDRKVNFFAGVPTLYTALNSIQMCGRARLISPPQIRHFGRGCSACEYRARICALGRGEGEIGGGVWPVRNAPIALLNPTDRPTVMHESGVGSVGLPALAQLLKSSILKRAKR